MSDETDETPAPQGDLVTTTAQLRRIDFSGTVWFAGGLVAAGAGLGGLLGGGWRPSRLPRPGAALWWTGSLGVLGSLGCLAWAGCPVLGDDHEESNRNKATAVRVGVVGYLAGGAAATLAVLRSPGPRPMRR